MTANIVKLSNRHPADRLAEIRDNIKTLQAEETSLRQTLINSPEDRTGNEWIASVTSMKAARFDFSAIIKFYGTEALKQFKRSETETVFVRLRKKKP